MLCLWGHVALAEGRKENAKLPKATIDGTGLGWVALGLQGLHAG